MDAAPSDNQQAPSRVSSLCQVSSPQLQVKLVLNRPIKAQRQSECRVISDTRNQLCVSSWHWLFETQHISHNKKVQMMMMMMMMK